MTTQPAARFARAVQEAQTAFWLELAEQFPECRTAIVPDDADAAFQEACARIAHEWLVYNGQAGRP